MTTGNASFRIKWIQSPVRFIQLCWVGEERLAVSSMNGMGVYDRRGQQLAFQTEPGLSLSWAPDADYIRYLHGGVKDWYWKKQVITPATHIRFNVFDGTFDRQGNYCCCGEPRSSDAGRAAIYHQDGQKLAEFDFMDRAKQLALSPDESRIAFCTQNGIIAISSFPSPQQEQEQFLRASGTVMAAAWSASGRYLAVALVHGGLEVWDVSSGQKLGSFEKIQKNGWTRFMSIRFIPGSDDLIIASNFFAGGTFLFDWKKHSSSIAISRAISFDLSPSEESIALAFPDGEIRISKLAEMSELLR